MVTLCGLQARSPAQVHFGVSVGERVAVSAAIGPVVFHGGSSYRAKSVSYRPRVTPRRHDHRYRPHRYVKRRAWVPGRYQLVRVPDKYGTRYNRCGDRVDYLIRRGHTKRVWRKGYWKRVDERVRFRRR